MPKNIALVGCGAIARAFYLSPLAKHRAKFDRCWLVDPSDHALSIAGSIVSSSKAHRFGDVDDQIHLVIVATPNPLHFQLAHEALLRGADVLIEKPFVIYPAEGRRLIEAAAANNRVIAINQTRRFYHLWRALARHLEGGEFGLLKSIVHREGGKLKWPFVSGAGFAVGAQRTGSIMDFGVHAIDFYHHLLQPSWTFVSAVHDGFSGPEGLAEIELEANGAPVSIRLSRYHPQDNCARLVFDRAQVSFNVHDPRTYSVSSNSGHSKLFETGRAEFDEISDAEVSERVLLNFLAASEKRESAVCDAASSLPVIEILDEIYRLARQYPAELGSV